MREMLCVTRRALTATLSVTAPLTFATVGYATRLVAAAGVEFFQWLDLATFATLFFSHDTSL